MQGLPNKHDSHNMTAALTKNNDKLVGEHGKLPWSERLPPSKDTPKWWECGGHVRGKKQFRESYAAGASGRASGTSGQYVTEKEKTKSTKFTCELAGHRPGLMSNLGGVDGCWLSKPQPGAAVQTKEAARVADVEARGRASQTEAPKQAKL